MQRYNESGKARKKCTCGYYVHARTIACICGNVFGTTKTKMREPVISSEPSRGKKLCKCGSYIGVRCIVCPSCSNMKFEKTEKQRFDKEDVSGYTGALIYTPSGDCPYKLVSEDKCGVFEWCRNVYIDGLKANKTYTKDALRYWFNNFKKSDLKKYIDEWASIEGFEKDSENESRYETSS